MIKTVTLTVSFMWIIVRELLLVPNDLPKSENQDDCKHDLYIVLHVYSINMKSTG